MSITPSSRQPDHPVDPQFPDRWSPRAFSMEPMAPETVLTLLEAARWAPSASNHQPWRFVWALRGEPGHAGLLQSLVASNAEWAGRAAALIAVASKTTVTGRDGATRANPWSAFDAGAAWVSLALQARHLGLYAHAMGGFDAARLAETIGLPADHSLHAVIAVGRQGRVEDLPEARRASETPNTRRPLAETAFRGTFPPSDA